MSTALAATIGAIIGALISTFGNWFMNKQKYENENAQADKKRNWELEDKQLAEAKEKENNKIIAYNKILKVAGEVMVVSSTGDYTLSHFRIKVYMDIIRPLFYENLHVLDRELVSKIRKIDAEIEKMNYLEDTEPEWLSYCAQQYDEILALIEAKYLDS
ncbi:hypothetical protein [Brevibacillus porteri]|uniref:hypothetical protein n=1 Tax=Brevibacillus porteri TaxID=2126350 RepID=UPI003D2553B4